MPIILSMRRAATSETRAQLLHLVQGLGGQDGHAMMLGWGGMFLEDGHSGVDYLWLDRLLVNDWLYCLVNMVVDVLASHGGCGLD